MSLDVQKAEHYNNLEWRKRPTSYDVSFWEKLNDPEPPIAPLWSEEARLVSGAESVLEVFAWAEANAKGRAFVIEALVPLDGKIGLVRLHGLDPTTGETA